MGKKVFLIGDINIDFTLKGVNNLPNLSEDQGIEISLEDISYTVGGSGFNFLKVISNFGVKVDFYAKIGDDLYGNYIKDYLEKENINNSLIVSDNSRTGITSIIPIKGDRVLLTFKGSNEKLCIDDLDLKKITYFDHLHFSSFYLLKDLQSEVLNIFKFLKSKDLTISFDTGFDPNEIWQRDKILSILKYVDIFIPNEIEALNITNKKTIYEAIELLSNYCPIVIIKLGPKGLIGKSRSSLEDNKVMHLPQYNINAVDTSCCGDSLNAGFMYSYLRNYSFRESLRFANACGALQATKIGSYRFNDIREIDDFMKKVS